MLKTVGKILVPVFLTILPLLLFAGWFFSEDFGKLAAAFDRERASLVEGYTGMAVKVAEPRPRRSTSMAPTPEPATGESKSNDSK